MFFIHATLFVYYNVVIVPDRYKQCIPSSCTLYIHKEYNYYMKMFVPH